MTNEKHLSFRKEKCRKIDVLIQQHLEDYGLETCGLDQLFPMLSKFYENPKSMRNFLRKLEKNHELNSLPSIEYHPDSEDQLSHWKWRCVRLPS